MESIPSQTIRGYEVIEVIGEGGFGAVYRAFQPAVKREVAIKMILPQYANDPNFIRSFETEAELIARLEHFHIIPLFDYWREPNGAYLVTRFLRGGSLRDRLEKDDPLSPQEVMRLTQQICSALSVSHRQGVIHRDLKPGNILLDEEGNMYLSDFGISISMDTSDTSQLTELIGTPAYLSPEQIMSEKVTPQSDIYSFGILLFEALTGKSPYPNDVSPIQLMQMVINNPLPSLRKHRTDLPEAVERVVFRATAKDPRKRYTDIMRLALDFRKALDDMVLSSMEMAQLSDDGKLTLPLLSPKTYKDDDNHTAPVPVDNDDLRDIDAQLARNPYKGLRAFQEADTNDFFGRKSLVDQLLYRMEGLQVDPALARFLALVGPSGSGKSSVVKAGLIPALRHGKLPDSKNWFVVDMIPSTRPFEELEVALLKVAVDVVPGLLEQLQSDERGLVRAVKRILPDDGSELLLVIDQFEEIFTLVDDNNIRQLFVDNMLSVINDPQGRVRIIITLRADFYDRPLLYEDLGKLIQQRTEVVLPLATDELESAIVEPAKQVGMSFEAGLVNRIVTDVGQQPGTLPLLQFALTELFERRVAQMMTLQAYQESGGVLGVLARRADKLYDEMDASDQVIVRQVSLRLVTLGTGTEDTRRRVRRSEITIADTDAEDVNRVLNLFGKHRLLTFDRDPITREPTIEVAHEALIRGWIRLQEWVSENREDLRIQRRLTIAVRDWDESGRHESYVSLGVRLIEFENFARNTDLALSLSEQAYLDASRQHENALLAADAELRTRVKRLRRVQYIAGLAAILALVGLIFILFQAIEAEKREDQAEQRKVEAERLAGDAKVALRDVEAVTKSLRFTNHAIDVMQDGNGNPEVAALLGIRALKEAYDKEGDAALIEAVERIYALHQLIGHRASITSVDFAPNGTTVLTGSEDGTARLWDVTTGQTLHRLEHSLEQELSDARFSSDGSLVLTVGQDNTARLWDVDTGETIHVLKEHTDFIQQGSFSPDGAMVLTGSDDGTARLWDVDTGETIHILNGHAGSVRHVVFSPDDAMILTGSDDGTARLWDVDTGEIIHILNGHADSVRHVVFSPDGAMILTGSDDGTARLWDVDTGETIYVLNRHTGWVRDVAFSPDGAKVLTGSEDGTARLWDVDTGELLHILQGHLEPVVSVAFSPDGMSVLTASWDHTARLWNASTGEERRVFVGHSDRVQHVAFSPDGSTVLTGSWSGISRLWDAVYTDSLYTLRGHTGSVVSVSVSSNGSMALTGSHDTTARLWDIGNFHTLQTLQGHTDTVVSVAFSPDDSIVLTGSWDGTARLWDTTTGETLHVLEGHTKAVVDVAFSPDGLYALTGSDDNTARLWNVSTGQTLYIFEGHTDRVADVIFSLDGAMILTGSWDYTARLWDTATGQLLHVLDGHTRQIMNVAFTSNGNIALTSSADNTAQLWDIDTGEAIRVLDGHINMITDMAIAPNDETVLTGSRDGTAYLWNVATGEQAYWFDEQVDRGKIVGVVFNQDIPLVLAANLRDNTIQLVHAETGELTRSLQGHTSEIIFVAFSEDRRIVITASADNTARIWHTNYHDFYADACTRVLRDFTDEERLEFGIDDSPTCPNFAPD